MKYCTMYKLTSRQNSKEVRADRGRRKYHGNYNNNIKKNEELKPKRKVSTKKKNLKYTWGMGAGGKLNEKRQH